LHIVELFSQLTNQTIESQFVASVTYLQINIQYHSKSQTLHIIWKKPEGWENNT